MPTTPQPLLVFPKYSFVQPAEPFAEGCYPDPQSYLPLSSPHNLSFKVRFERVPDIPWGGLTQHSLFAEAVPLDVSCEYSSSSDGAGDRWTDFITPTFANVGLDSYGYKYDAWFRYGINDFDFYNEHTLYREINIGDCFKLRFVMLHLDPDDRVQWVQILGCTQPFIRTPEGDCFSSVIKYRNPDDSFDFEYSAYSDFYNKVELPMYLRDPIMNNDTKVYTKSNGEIVKLYERKEEQYILETDLLSYTRLKALDVALSHDSVSIQNTNTSAFDHVNTATNFQKRDNMEIEYQKGGLSALGKGTCKLLNANPVHLYNNNCS